jgi:3-oxoadipate enol-lactonase
VPVVLVHNTPSTLFSFSELIHGSTPDDGRGDFAGLSAGRDVYAIELIGHGIAPGQLPAYSFELCARFISAAIRALKLERVHLLGTSYAGEFVWRAALNDPDLIASLTLIDSSGIRRRDQDWLSEEMVMRENSLAKWGWLLNSSDRIEAALAPHFQELPPDRVEEFLIVCENSENWSAMIDLVRDENGDREGELAQIVAPTLILWGADDIAYPLAYYGQRFAKEIPRSELVVLPETGHYPHEERPAEVLQILYKFFDNHKVSP